MNLYPLVVDLDGTLIHTDILHESTLQFFKQNPLEIFQLPIWLFKSKAYLKENLASRVEFDPTKLPYNQELLTWLKKQKSEGRKLVLCTASDQIIANTIAKYLGFFDEIISSNGIINLAGEKKAQILEEKFGYQGFDYVGNSKIDLAVWKYARRAVIVGDPKRLVKQTQNLCEVEQIFKQMPLNFKTLARAVRVHQWLKNLLLLVPLLAAHNILGITNWGLLFFAFFAFCFCASAVYIINDLLDLESDRVHPRKRDRPFASGQIPAWKGLITAPILLAISFFLAYSVNLYFLFWLIFYFVLTCAYSIGLKHLVLIDCIALAMLYTLRIVAGAAAVRIDLSFWILAFSAFLFLSLSFLKRCAELVTLSGYPQEKVHGRDYYSTDAPLVQMLGIASGYVSVLILSLYLNSEKVIMLYKMPQLLWAAIPIVLFWISWMWLQVYRGLMHDDPLIFAIKDKVSLLTGMIFTAIIIMSAVGVS